MTDSALDIGALLRNLASEARKQKAEKRRETARRILTTPVVTDKEIRLSRLTSSRWKDEALVTLVTESRCECGANFESPSPYLFIRRYHPIWGIHFEALGARPVATTMKYYVERQVIHIPHCHRCLTPEDVQHISAQLPLTFTDQETPNDL